MLFTVPLCEEQGNETYVISKHSLKSYYYLAIKCSNTSNIKIQLFNSHILFLLLCSSFAIGICKQISEIRGGKDLFCGQGRFKLMWCERGRRYRFCSHKII